MVIYNIISVIKRSVVQANGIEILLYTRIIKDKITEPQR